MNTTNRNVKQRNSYYLENGCKQPHFETGKRFRTSLPPEFHSFCDSTISILFIHLFSSIRSLRPVRAGQGPTRAFKMPTANVPRDANLYKNYSAFGAQQYSSVQRSSSGSFDGLSRDFSLESYKKSLNRNINSGNSVLSLLKNSSSLSSSGRIIDTDRQANTSSSSNVVTAAPLHNAPSPFVTPLSLAAFQTPGSSAKIGLQKRQLTSKTNE